MRNITHFYFTVKSNKQLNEGENMQFSISIDRSEIYLDVIISIRGTEIV